MTRVRFNTAILLPLLALWAQPVANAAVLHGAAQSFMTADAQNRCDPADPNCYSKLSMDFAHFVLPQAPQSPIVADNLQLDAHALALSEAPAASGPGDSKAAEAEQVSAVPDAMQNADMTDIVLDIADQNDELMVVVESVLTDGTVHSIISDMKGDAGLFSADDALQSPQQAKYIAPAQVAQVPAPPILLLLAVGVLGMRLAHRKKA